MAQVPLLLYAAAVNLSDDSRLFVQLKNCHNCSNQCEDGVELRKCSVDEGVGHYIVSLALTDDTVGADLTLTDG